MNVINKVNENIDWTIVTSTIVAGVVLSVSVLALKKVGLNSVAKVVKG